MDPKSEGPNLIARPSQGTRSSAPMAATEVDAIQALEQIRAHLEEGRYRSAQRLAQEAGAQFPEHPDIRTMNRGLNGGISGTSPAAGHSRREEFAWLRNPPQSARGKLVALVGSEMVASADTMSELKAALKLIRLPKMPLVHRIDS